jgi:transcriptional regulator
MTLSMGYLTPTQKKIWDLKSTGIAEACVARKLHVTRQTVHKALDIANSKINQSLEEIAKINKIKVQTINSATGVLIGYSNHFKTKALITFSVKNGVQLWYKHEGDCKNCEQMNLCKTTLVAEAQDRNIQLPEFDSMSPSELADILFTKITGEHK